MALLAMQVMVAEARDEVTHGCGDPHGDKQIPDGEKEGLVGKPEQPELYAIDIESF
jgi:hypothetical protein